MKRLLFKALPVLLFSAIFVSCDKDDDNDPPVRETAKITVVHASPGSPDVDVYLDTAKITSSQIAYGNYSGTAGNPYVLVDAGQSAIRVTNDGSTNFFQGNVNLEKDKSYTLFVYDTANNGNVKTVLLEDAPAAAGAGNSNMRFLHLSPDAPAGNIYWINSAGDTVSRSENVSYIGASPDVQTLSPFTSMASGDYRVVVTSGGNTILELPQVQVAEGKNYTFYARGLTTGTGANAIGVGSVQYN